MKAKLYFEPRDMWIGVFWKAGHSGAEQVDRYRDRIWTEWHAYICIIPMICLRLTWRRWIWRPRP